MCAIEVPTREGGERAAWECQARADGDAALVRVLFCMRNTFRVTVTSFISELENAWWTSIREIRERF